MKYLKTYEAVKADKIPYLPIDSEILNIVENCLNNNEIPKKGDLSEDINNIFEDIKSIWTDINDELYNIIDDIYYKIENSEDYLREPKNRLNVFLKFKNYPNYDELDSLVKADKHARKILNDYKNYTTISNLEDKLLGSKKIGIREPLIEINYQYPECINYWEKIKYDGDDSIRVNIYQNKNKLDGTIIKSQFERTVQLKNIIENELKTEFDSKDLKIRPLISYGGVVGHSGRHDHILIKFFKIPIILNE